MPSNVKELQKRLFQAESKISHLQYENSQLRNALKMLTNQIQKINSCEGVYSKFQVKFLSLGSGIAGGHNEELSAILQAQGESMSLSPNQLNLGNVIVSLPLRS